MRRTEEKALVTPLPSRLFRASKMTGVMSGAEGEEKAKSPTRKDGVWGTRLGRAM